MSANATFYNKMPFEVKMRRIWLKDNPPIVIPPGGQIEGPYDLLSQYTFLAVIQMDFSRVESIIQGPNYEYRDELLEPNNNIKVVSGPDKIDHEEVEKNIEEVESTKRDAIEEEPKTEEIEVEIDINNPPNWLSVKVEQLIKMAKELNVDTAHTANMKPKDKKWELVKLVKAALKKRQDSQVQ